MLRVKRVKRGLTPLRVVAATEERVVKHLQDHLEQLPEQDERSRKVLQQMLEDERQHGDVAAAAGGKDFPAVGKGSMGALSQLMTESTSRL
ncbi:MAG: demethoxyubiquinone hydroxylase family protein [Halieaceae bacterium]|nr:demethoxyubiquinone hydroxylase family protein [Halieaceae bacterium]